MIDDIGAARDAALERIAAAATLDDIVGIDQDVLGRRGSLTLLKTSLGSLGGPDDRRVAGRALNAATQAVTDALDDRRRALTDAARADRIAAERLDLT